MSKNNKRSVPGNEAGSDSFLPRASLRESELWQNGQPDPRLVKMVELLARQTAREHFEAELLEEKKLKEKERKPNNESRNIRSL